MVQPLGVDSSVTMLHGAWFRGGTLYAVPRELGLDAAAFARFLQSERIDYLKIAPSHFEALQAAANQPRTRPRRDEGRYLWTGRTPDGRIAPMG
jgi:non-ribosomal peptide synthetase component F